MKVLVNDSFVKSIEKFSKKHMSNELQDISKSISSLEKLDNIDNSNKISKIQGENIYVMNVSQKLRLVFTSTLIENSYCIILLEVFTHDDYIRYLDKRIFNV